MRTILMFDLPVETVSERREYRKFSKLLKKEGYVRLQKSIYTKLCINRSQLDHELRVIRSHLPMDGLISVLNITEKQYHSIEHLIGEPTSNIINTDSRYIEL